ncbi:MAG: hypothetical protein JXO72_03385 [Vicinamibacteria bacterium]|nr:hypothetical protein [Vicinamibacteria bacterium]
MKPALLLSACALVWCHATLGAAQSGEAEEAKPRDLQRLQDDLLNLDEELQRLDPETSGAEEFQKRAEEIREETTYLKVKMRRHRQAGMEGTGVDRGEIANLRLTIDDLRDDIEQASRAEAREARVPEGTEILVTLEEALSSKLNRVEDGFEMSVHQSVRAQDTIAIRAGTRARGTVRYAEPAQHPSRSGRLELNLDWIEVEKTRIDLKGRIVAVGAQTEKGLGTGEKAGIGAVLGGVLGGILGGKKGVLTGVLLGGGGAIVATKGDEVELPAGTILTYRLDREIVVPREQTPAD